VVDVRRGESTAIQTMRPDDIESLWRQEVAANPNLIAAVKTHPDAPHRHMIDVLDALQSAGAERISLQILEE
jgi:biopolymer transport protein ExbD